VGSGAPGPKTGFSGSGALVIVEVGAGVDDVERGFTCSGGGGRQYGSTGTTMCICGCGMLAMYADGTGVILVAAVHVLLTDSFGPHGAY
jgi:hypothetical protein